MNLLKDPIFSVRFHDGSRGQGSLPEILSWLATGQRLEFTALRPHQQAPWFQFLCQVAAQASFLHLDQKFPGEPKAWSAALFQLGCEMPEVWEMVQPDHNLPGFMQCPCPKVSGFHEVYTPDEVDLIVTSKNHDLKSSRMSSAREEHWVYALIALQTISGYNGAGNYGASRIKGAYTSRPLVSVVSSYEWSPRFLRDTRILMEQRETISREHGLTGKIGLVWLVPWDGEKDTSLSMDRLDPNYVDICRIVRLMPDGKSGLMGKTKTSKCLRITKGTAGAEVDEDDGKGRQGKTGDPWAPVHREKDHVLNLGVNGISYRLLVDLLLSGVYTPSASMRLRPEDGEEPFLLVQGLGRDEGNYGNLCGYHERLLPIPAKVFCNESIRQAMATRATSWLERVEMARLRVLRTGLIAFTQGGAEKLDLGDDAASAKIESRIGNFVSSIDQEFFPRLWASEGKPDQEALTEFDAWVLSLAWKELLRGFNEITTSSSSFYKSTAKAENFAAALLRKHFPDASFKDLPKS